MKTIFLALGSNVGDSHAFIQQAIELLGEKIKVTKSAPIYRSKAVGYTDQPDFLNTVIEGETNLSAVELLTFVKEIEEKVGRVKRFRWGPREVDIDIIFYGQEIINEPGLHIPHPQFAERDFVLKPLYDLNPALINPISKQTVQEIYKNLPNDNHSILTTLGDE